MSSRQSETEQQQKKYEISRKCGVKQIESQTQIDITIFNSFTVIYSEFDSYSMVYWLRAPSFIRFFYKKRSTRKKTDCQTKKFKIMVSIFSPYFFFILSSTSSSSLSFPWLAVLIAHYHCMFHLPAFSENLDEEWKLESLVGLCVLRYWLVDSIVYSSQCFA